MRLLPLSLILILWTPLHAADHKAPIEIRADNAIWDKKNNLTILSGNVAVTFRGMRLAASCVKAFGRLESLDRIIGEGRIEITDPANKATITGGYIEYDCKKEYGFITLNPVLKRELDNLCVTSLRMEYFFKEKEFIATGEVEIHYRDLIAKAGRAVYHQDGRLILTERPEITRRLDRFNGEVITIYTREERLEIVGGVSGTILAADYHG